MVVHPRSHRVSRVRWYSGYSLSASSFTYGALTLCGWPSQTIQLDSSDHDASPNPRNTEVLLVWPFPRSLATTCGISVDVFSCPYLDVSVQGVPLIQLFIHYMIHRYCLCVLPHSDISGSKLICSSPKLFVACHVLHRLLMPRHSPCALISLTYYRCSCSLVLLNYAGSTEVVFRNCILPLIKVFHNLVLKVLSFTKITPSVALLCYH